MAAALAKLRRIVIESGRDAGVVEDDPFDRDAKRPMIVPAEVEHILHELCSPPTLDPILLFEEPRANGHDRKVTAKKPAPTTKVSTQRRQTLGEQMARYNELVDVAIAIGLTRFCRRGLNGSTFATREAGDRATQKIEAAIEAARQGHRA